MLEINRILLLGCMLPLVLFAADPQTKQVERTRDDATAIRQSSRPSHVNPIGAVDSMRQMTIKLGKDIDLSGYDKDSMELVLGYGVYDAKDEHCVYAEKPANRSISIDFKDVISIQNKTYAVAKSKQSFSGCIALAAKYAGYVFVPDTQEEQSIVYNKYIKSGGSAWVGLTRNDCNKPGFVSQSGEIPDYQAWGSDIACTASRRNIELSTSNSLQYSDESSQKQCVIEIDSPDVLRPLKVCAPWWRIERSYENIWYEQDVETARANGGQTKVDLKSIFRGNMPVSMDLCLKVEPDPACDPVRIRQEATAFLQKKLDGDALTNGQTPSKSSIDVEVRKRSTYHLSCTKYYDIARSPLCADNPQQELCLINECAGTIEATCELEDTIPSYDNVKSYTKVMSEEGTIDSKRKVDITTNIYRCPKCATNIWSGCKERAKVQVWGQYCDDNQTIVYPDPSQYDYDGTTGELLALYGVCPNGQKLRFDVDGKISVQSKQCKEWEEANTTAKHDFRCTVERDGYNVSILAGTDELDIYGENPNCLRINTIEEARPEKDYELKWKQGDARLVGYHLLPAGTPQKVFEGADNGKIAQYMAWLEVVKSNSSVANQSFNMPEAQPDPLCNKFTDDWVDKLGYEAFMGENFTGPKPQFMYNNGSKKILVYKDATKAQCDQIASNTGGSKIYRKCKDGYDLNTTSGHCEKLPLKTCPSGTLNTTTGKCELVETTSTTAMATQCQLKSSYGSNSYTQVSAAGNSMSHVYPISSSGKCYFDSSGAGCVGKTRAVLSSNTATSLTMDNPTVTNTSNINWGYVTCAVTTTAYSYTCPSGWTKVDNSTCKRTVSSDPIPAECSIGDQQIGGYCRNLNGYHYTQGADLNTYPISQFAINPYDVLHIDDNTTAKRTCLISKPVTSADIFEKGTTTTISGLETILLTSISSMDSEACLKTAACIDGDGSVQANGKCLVTINEETGGYEEPIEIEVDLDKRLLPGVAESTNNGTVNGTGILYFAEVVDGVDFAPASTYHTHQFRLSQLEIAGRKLHPIQIEPYEIKEALDYSWNHYQKRIRSGKPHFSNGELRALPVVGGDSSFATYLFTSQNLIAGLIKALWGKYQDFSGIQLDWKIAKPVPANKMIIGEGGKRLDPSDTRGLYVNQDTAKAELLYHGGVFFWTGMTKPSHAEAIQKAIYKIKVEELKNAGYMDPWQGHPEAANVTKANNLTRTAETGYIASRPGKCKFYVPPSSCTKTNEKTDAGSETRYRITTGFWTQATNALTIVVPYRGNYEVSAYDKWGNKLASVTTATDGFKDLTGNNWKTHPIIFGTQMTLSDGYPLQPFQNEADACRNNLMVEWGGGVSGIYYENSNCGKSHDDFVRDHAATKIVVRPINADSGYEIKLERPLPYANKIALTTLDYEEHREYTCFQEGVQCQPPSEF